MHCVPCICRIRIKWFREIPSSVKTIGDYAFSECNITSIKLNEGLEIIKHHAFMNCKNLSDEIYIPSTVTFVGPQAFAKNDLITKIHVHKDNVIKWSEKWNNRCNTEIIYY